MNDFNRHKKSDKIKWGLTAVAFLLLVVMLACVCLEVFGKGKVKPSEWFTKEEQQVEQDGGAETGGLQLSETTEGNGIALMSTVIPIEQYDEYGIMPIAESAQTLTATVQPEEAAPFARITWTAAWKGGNGGGKDVSEFLTLSFGNDIDTSKRCTVSCLKAFSTQIIITASVVDQPEMNTSVTADYVRRYEQTSFVVDAGGSVTENYIGSLFDFAFNYSRSPKIGVIFEFGVGTKFPDTVNEESLCLYLKLDGVFKNLLSKNTASSGITYTDTVKIYGKSVSEDTFSEVGREVGSSLMYTFTPTTTFASPAAAFLTGASASNPDHIKRFNSVFAGTINEANRSEGYHASLTTDDTINFSFNGKSYGSASGTTWQFKFSMDGLKILADSISPSQGSIYF